MLANTFIEVFKTLVRVWFLGILTVVETLYLFVIDAGAVVFLSCVTLELSFGYTVVEF